MEIKKLYCDTCLEELSENNYNLVITIKKIYHFCDDECRKKKFAGDNQKQARM